MWDIIIVGAGTAGLTAAVYAGRAGKKVMLLEHSIHGGQIINTSQVENFPGFAQIAGFEFATALYEQAVSFGAELVYEECKKIENVGNYKKVVTSRGEYEAKSVILATGARPRLIGLDKEEGFIGRGISFCATCDGSFYKDKIVAVVGGGNTAFDDALVLSNLAKKVYLVHRSQKFTAEKQLVERVVAKDNVEFVLDSDVKGLLGDKRIEGLQIVNNTSGEVREIAIDGMFLAIGYQPINDVFSDIVELDKAGYIVAGEDCRTSCDGIFAAGDCRTKNIRQLTTATADGTVAALAACEYIDR